MLQFNTAVSTLMIWINYLEKKKAITWEEYETFIKLLSPFAPHVTQELWHLLSSTASYIFMQDWPLYQDKYLTEEKVNIAVQVNGKLRDTIQVKLEQLGDKEFVENLAKDSEKVKKYLESVKKVIYVEGRIINFVV